ncbi:Fur family transcriptional regulator [Poriferisphaera sp. WC338]|uniref:Fur family transcriptional regulator n=1 Tax=Poriferisphaera sp. WC338 TaxID=3425129 RepID=UPI003D81A30A
MPKTKQSMPKRNTVQRKTVERVIDAAEGPLTVQEIHDAASSLCEVGIATVYRIVKTLHEDEQISCVVLPDGQNRYENAHLGHHHHFRCKQCGRVFDLHLCPVSLPEGTTLPGGFVVDGHELTLFGLCPECSSGTTSENNVEAGDGDCGCHGSGETKP